jgi:hypothetical protein
VLPVGNCGVKDFVHEQDKMVWNLEETKGRVKKNLSKFTAKF